MWMTSTTYQPTTLILLHAWDQFMTDVISQIVHFILIIMLNCDLCHLWFTSPNKSISPASLYVQLLPWRHFKKENWHIPFSFILTQNSFHSVRIDHKYFAIKTLTTWTLQKITWVCKFFKRSFAKNSRLWFLFYGDRLAIKPWNSQFVSQWKSAVYWWCDGYSTILLFWLSRLHWAALGRVWIIPVAGADCGHWP